MDILTGDDISLAAGEKIPPQLRNGNFRFIRVKAKERPRLMRGGTKIATTITLTSRYSSIW